MIIRITRHPRDAGAGLAFTPPELAQTMGLFGPARYSPEDSAYAIDAGDIERFIRFLGHYGHRVIDERLEAPTDEKFKGPLPECRACGQPASRKVAAKLRFCPACGEAWDPMVFESTPRAGAVTVTCEGCGHRQAGAGSFHRCGQCGVTLPDLAVATERAAALAAAVREQLAEPMLFGETIADTPQLRRPEDGAA